MIKIAQAHEQTAQTAAQAAEVAALQCETHTATIKAVEAQKAATAALLALEKATTGLSLPAPAVTAAPAARPVTVTIANSSVNAVAADGTAIPTTALPRVNKILEKVRNNRKAFKKFTATVNKNWHLNKVKLHQQMKLPMKLRLLIFLNVHNTRSKRPQRRAPTPIIHSL